MSRTGHARCVGIEQPLFRVVEVLLSRGGLPLDAVHVAVAWARVAYMNVPDIPNPVPLRRQLEFVPWFGIVRMIEKKKPHPGSVATEQAELDAVFDTMGPVRDRQGNTRQKM